MNYEEWEKTVSEKIKADSLWKMQAYRLATLLGDLAWHDVTKLYQDRRTIGVAEQLYSAVGSIGANLAEGYSMGTSKNRARYYEYALGSARESRDWYNKGRHVLSEPISEHRFDLLVKIIRLLLTMVPEQRQHTLREANTLYNVESDFAEILEELAWSELAPILENIPLP